MAILKCKMCGGTIEYVPGTTVGECQHCGTKQTLPKTGDEVVSNLFNRANNMRLKCEFDKAMSIYEKIVEQDDSEAEAHWGIVLCRYGIEYVEDPATKKRIPTCHRTLYDAVTMDPDYQAALDYSDTLQQTIYEKEAKEIDKIQKGILAIVQNEEPFDVFICYKETDEEGNRTKDSVIANDIYHQLTLEGYKVFYAAITLEDKLGQEYEPYIFAALNTAKVMLVIGSRPEYFNAVWVKNEWSRFLNLMKTDRSKILIPCYKDMDAYELPEEFSHLQAQDMSKLGFMLDLNRVIKKIIDTKDQKIEVKEVRVVSSDSNVAPNVAPLLKRVFMFLEDNNWAEADTYCEKVLDIDPENAEAYIGKLMAELHVGIQENLSKCKQPFDTNINYKKAVRFGSLDIANTLDGYINQINERIKKEQLTETYNRGIKAMNNANDEQGYQAAAKIFESIFGFQDSGSLYNQCNEKAEVCRKEAIYSSAKKKMATASQISSYESAIELFSSIPDWKDSKEQINTCRNCIEKIKTDREIVRQENQRKLEEKEIAKEKAKKCFKKVATITFIVIVIALVFGVIWDEIIIPELKYNDAVELLDSGNYVEAIDAFNALNGYKDSEDQIMKCETAIKDEKYAIAVDLYNLGNYDEAITAFKALDGYADSEAQIINCETAIMDAKYDSAVNLYNLGNYDEAITAFKALDGYKDSNNQIINCETAIMDDKYDSAMKLYDSGNYDEAIATFMALDGYKDSIDQIEECKKNIKQNIVAALSTASNGTCVSFGTYEQDDLAYNGKEDIEWLVLNRTDNRILVISRYAIDCQPYNKPYGLTTWEKCSLRKWLNETFLNDAFSLVEKSMIYETKITADENPKYNTIIPGNETNDYVFLLSISELQKYLKEDSERRCIPTRYTIDRGVWVKNTCCWWLRTPGVGGARAARVDTEGAISYYGIGVDQAVTGVRPSMWISLE